MEMRRFYADRTSAQVVWTENMLRMVNSRVDMKEYKDTVRQELVWKLVDFYLHVEEPEHKSIKSPKTWWDHLKLHPRFPKWFVKRWPVEYREEKVVVKHTRICPHLSTKGEGHHVQFLCGCLDRGDFDERRKADIADWWTKRVKAGTF